MLQIQLISSKYTFTSYIKKESKIKFILLLFTNFTFTGRNSTVSTFFVHFLKQYLVIYYKDDSKSDYV